MHLFTDCKPRIHPHVSWSKTHRSWLKLTTPSLSNLKQLQNFQVCPFLLRVFLCEGRHHTMSEYTNKRTPPTARELQIYTWLDASLSELMGLIRELPEYRSKGTQFSFSVVFPEPSSPTYRMRHVGVTIGGKRGPDDEKTLSQSRLQIGDFIDVAIMPLGADISKLNNNQSVNKRNRIRNRGGGGPPGRFYRS